MKIEKKFYVGAAFMPERLKYETVEEAVAEAAKMIDKDDRYDERVIVQIIKVVKRIPPPVQIEDVE
jgi:hypothetical protein